MLVINAGCCWFLLLVITAGFCCWLLLVVAVTDLMIPNALSVAFAVVANAVTGPTGSAAGCVAAIGAILLLTITAPAQALVMLP